MPLEERIEQLEREMAELKSKVVQPGKQLKPEELFILASRQVLSEGIDLHRMIESSKMCR